MTINVAKPTDSPTCSVVIPVYGNRATLPAVIERLLELDQRISGHLEAVFVVDGSPDDSYHFLLETLPTVGVRTQLISHSRNYGSFAAIRTGLEHSTGDYIAAMAADLQEPASLIVDFFTELSRGETDVVVGTRASRQDPLLSSTMSRMFWGFYRRAVHRAIPPGGVDIFGCTRAVADRLVSLEESHSSLVGLLYWVGFRRHEISYERQQRTEGKSGWSFRRKLRYFLDSVYSFTDLPITVVVLVGAIGTMLTVTVSVITVIARILGLIDVPGYTALMLVVLLSTTSILFALGVVGSYVWRTYENSKNRPSAIAMAVHRFDEESA